MTRRRRALPLLLLAAVVAWSPLARGQVCLGNLTPQGAQDLYGPGFTSAQVTLFAGLGFAGSGLGGCTTCPIQLSPGQSIGFGVSQPGLNGAVPAIWQSATPASYTLDHVRFHAKANFPAPCPAPTAALGSASSVGGSEPTRVDLYYSVDSGAHFELVPFPTMPPPPPPLQWPKILAGPSVETEALVDLLGLGLSGNDLLWKVIIRTNTPGCQPVLASLQVGYEALPNGVYQMSESLPVANVLLRSSYETTGGPLPAPPLNDTTVRGHLTAKVLYTLDTLPITDYSDPSGPAPPDAWSIGDAARSITYPPAAGNPDSRILRFNNGLGSAVGFRSTNALLLGIILDTPAHSVRYPASIGPLLYDFDGNGTSDNTDAAWLINWVRGWADGNAKTTRKSWGLGPILRATPAVVGPPGDPWWLAGSGTPAAERTAYGTPCVTTPGTFVTNNVTRASIAIVGSQDGFFHAFDMGQFRWCDDPSTSLYETHGWFDHAGARNYGTGAERWAWAPPGLMEGYKNMPPRTLFYETIPDPTILQVPRASADASISVADVCLGGAGCIFSTLMVAPETRAHPFVTALDVTATVFSPVPQWIEDWPPAGEGDMDFEGTEFSPSLGPVMIRGMGRTWAAATSSGIKSVPSDVFLYLIDLQSGHTFSNGAGTRDGWGRAKLNLAGALADCSAQTFGSVGPPVMVDSNQDGVVDRVYLTDTKGCLYKVDTATMTTCPLASLGETVYAPIAVRVADDVAGSVQIYVAGGDDPDALDPATGPYHLFAIEDDDGVGACSRPRQLFKVNLTPNGAGKVHKVWSAPTVNGDAVYVATSVGDLNDPCSSDPNNPGLLLGYSLASTLTGVPQPLVAQSLGGNSAGGVKLFDGHLFVNSQAGTTTVLGHNQSWGTSAPVNLGGAQLLTTPVWNEH